MYQIINGYRDNDTLRASFDALSVHTFDLSFEKWYQNGFWSDNYNPYSIVINGEIAANVSVNRMDMCIDGRDVRLIQLGTVMTKPEYRHRGLIREIMNRIEAEYADVDGMFLYANDSVLDFYPKFGFQKAKEFCCSKTVTQSGQYAMERIPMDGPAQWAIFRKAMDENRFRGRCDMLRNPELVFFYVSRFMRNNVFYSRELDAYVVADYTGADLKIFNIYTAQDVTLDDVIAAFGGEVKKVTLGFSPADSTGFTQEELIEEDNTFFVKGTLFEAFQNEKLRMPFLSRA